MTPCWQTVSLAIPKVLFPGQIKLLRLLQEREYYALGFDVVRTTNVRMIFFTHCGLDSLQKNKPAYPGELPILLGTYDYPGNVRELQSMVFDALSKHGSRTLSMDVFKEYIEKRLGTNLDTPNSVEGETVFSVLGGHLEGIEQTAC
jgi:transcriptional regulator with AAA-type ATPase domain